jgi:hypothetical protein
LLPNCPKRTKKEETTIAQAILRYKLQNYTGNKGAKIAVAYMEKGRVKPPY